MEGCTNKLFKSFFLGEEDEQAVSSQALVYSQADHTIVSQATADQMVLAQPIVAKEVSIETTPVHTMSLLVHATDDLLLANVDVIPKQKQLSTV